MAEKFIRTGYVYFIKCHAEDQPIKIGWSAKKPQMGRLADLQIASPFELEVIAYIRGTVADERRLHKEFIEHHIRGEWFKKSDQLLNLIEQVGNTQIAPEQPKTVAIREKAISEGFNEQLLNRARRLAQQRMIEQNPQYCTPTNQNTVQPNKRQLLPPVGNKHEKHASASNNYT